MTLETPEEQRHAGIGTGAAGAAVLSGFSVGGLESGVGRKGRIWFPLDGVAEVEGAAVAVRGTDLGAGRKGVPSSDASKELTPEELSSTSQMYGRVGVGWRTIPTSTGVHELWFPGSRSNNSVH